MTLKPFEGKIVDLYIEQELLLSEIYKTLAQKHPSYAQFWNGLMGEELEHAGWVKKLKEYADQGMATFHEGKTRSYTLSTYINYLKTTLEKVKKEIFDIRKAVSIAVDMEKSLIEKQVFEHFDGDSEEVSRVLRILKTATEEHLARVEGFRFQ